jgi:glutaconate CoA-transferase subunit A
MTEFLCLDEAVSRFVYPGCTFALEGFTHLIPFAAAHQIIRRRITGLTLVRMTPDIIYDQMIGSGCARRLVFAWGGNPGVGLLHRLRDAVERQWPHPLEIDEHSHAGLAHAYAAGAAGMPCAILRGYQGSDLPRVNANIRSVICPFTGEQLACVPAIRPDVTIVHAQRADRDGNVLVEGILGVQKEAALAAAHTIVTVEEIVDRLTATGPNAVILPSWIIDAVVLVPGGAHPSYAHGYYDRDNAFYAGWDAISRDRAAFDAWMRDHVVNSAPECFRARAYGSAGALRAHESGERT